MSPIFTCFYIDNQSLNPELGWLLWRQDRLFVLNMQKLKDLNITYVCIRSLNCLVKKICLNSKTKYMKQSTEILKIKQTKKHTLYAVNAFCILESNIFLSTNK